MVPCRGLRVSGGLCVSGLYPRMEREPFWTQYTTRKAFLFGGDDRFPIFRSVSVLRSVSSQ